MLIYAFFSQLNAEVKEMKRQLHAQICIVIQKQNHSMNAVQILLFLSSMAMRKAMSEMRACSLTVMSLSELKDGTESDIEATVLTRPARERKNQS